MAVRFPCHKGINVDWFITGLVILSATYTASGEDGESPISIDVTVALQAQVHNSQLLIPGGRSKVRKLISLMRRELTAARVKLPRWLFWDFMIRHPVHAST